MINNIIKLGGYVLLAKEAADYLAGSRIYRERERRRDRCAWTTVGSVAGLTAGVALGILFAPRAGKETREMISTATDEIITGIQCGLTEGKEHLEEVIGRKKEEFCTEENPEEPEYTGESIS